MLNIDCRNAYWPLVFFCIVSFPLLISATSINTRSNFLDLNRILLINVFNFESAGKQIRGTEMFSICLCTQQFDSAFCSRLYLPFRFCSLNYYQNNNVSRFSCTYFGFVIKKTINAEPENDFTIDLYLNHKRQQYAESFLFFLPASIRSSFEAL